jgi:hypothetical protein
MLYYVLVFAPFICSLVISIILALLLYIVPVKSSRLADKISAYVCEFQHYRGTRSIYDVKYYIVAILFLLLGFYFLYIRKYLCVFYVILFISFCLVFVYLDTHFLKSKFYYLLGGTTALIVHDETTPEGKIIKPVKLPSTKVGSLEENFEILEEVFIPSSSDGIDPISIIAGGKNSSLSTRDPLTIILKKTDLSELAVFLEKKQNSNVSAENPKLADSALIEKRDSLKEGTIDVKVNLSSNFNKVLDVNIPSVDVTKPSGHTIASDLNLMFADFMLKFKTKCSAIYDMIHSSYKPQVIQDYYETKKVVDQKVQDPQSFFDWLFDLCCGNWIFFVKLLILLGLFWLFLRYFKDIFKSFSERFKGLLGFYKRPEVRVIDNNKYVTKSPPNSEKRGDKVSTSEIEQILKAFRRLWNKFIKIIKRR